MKILLISDSHGFIDKSVLDQVGLVDEVWHAGDFGTIDLINTIRDIKPLKGVFGNIDGREIRNEFPEQLFFTVKGLKVGMIHIGGYPPRYEKGVKEILKEEKPGLFISGHSHILKVSRDEELGLLHMNPGAIGKQGFHQVRTALKFEIENSAIRNLQAIEFGKK